MSEALTWDHPNSDPIGDIEKMLRNYSGPRQPVLHVGPQATKILFDRGQIIEAEAIAHRIFGAEIVWSQWW